MREALLIEIGTVYGPPDTRNSVPGGVTMICAGVAAPATGVAPGDTGWSRGGPAGGVKPGGNAGGAPPGWPAGVVPAAGGGGKGVTAPGAAGFAATGAG